MVFTLVKVLGGLRPGAGALNPILLAIATSYAIACKVVAFR
ncbi:hypothetical protein [Caulobacter hibisci]|nr:hypothetical protein [Caulobacter hibisci]